MTHNLWVITNIPFNIDTLSLQRIKWQYHHLNHHKVFFAVQALQESPIDWPLPPISADWLAGLCIAMFSLCFIPFVKERIKGLSNRTEMLPVFCFVPYFLQNENIKLCLILNWTVEIWKGYIPTQLFETFGTTCTLHLWYSLRIPPRHSFTNNGNNFEVVSLNDWINPQPASGDVICTWQVPMKSKFLSEFFSLSDPLSSKHKIFKRT